MKLKIQLLIITIIFISLSLNALAKIKTTLPTVVIVSTGGTIASKANSKANGAVTPVLIGEKLVKDIPELKKIANIKVINFCNIDSSHMTPDIWTKLSKTVEKILKNPKVKGVVVTHGTDTMDVGAFFLYLTITSKKPVVFTGAMRSASSLSSDGAINILNSVKEVISPSVKNWGVTINLNNYINSARFARKTDTTNVQTFTSGNHGYLGYMVKGNVIFYNKGSHIKKFSIPKKLPKVTLIQEYAGADGSLVNYAVQTGAKGIVIEALGAGNVGLPTYRAILEAIKKGVVVVITSRVPYGSVFPLYGIPGGGQSLQKAGAILANYLTGPKARILLMLAIANAKGDVKKIKNYFEKI